MDSKRLKKLHKKADIIAALRCNKEYNPCSDATCADCGLAPEVRYRTCAPVDLNRKMRKELANAVEKHNVPADFRTPSTVRVLIVKLGDKLWKNLL